MNAEKKEYFMRLALEKAKEGYLKDEVPVGAVIVYNDKVIAAAHNLKEYKNCSNYHAEMVAIEIASNYIGDWRLEDCSLFVTLEPCLMCAGAIINSRLTNVYYGAKDPRFGSCGSLYDVLTDSRLNHVVKDLQSGILEKECSELLTSYFKEKRNGLHLYC